jgi:hypothetical protein
LVGQRKMRREFARLRKQLCKGIRTQRMKLVHVRKEMIRAPQGEVSAANLHVLTQNGNYETFVGKSRTLSTLNAATGR